MKKDTMFVSLAGAVVLVVLIVIYALGMMLFSVTPGPGEEIVIVRYPTVMKLFYNGGVDSTPFTNGRKLKAPTSAAKIVDMKPMQFQMNIDDMFSKDNVPLDFTAVMRIRVLDSVRLVDKFGVDMIKWNDNYSAPAWYSNNVFRTWERAVRRAVNKRGMNEMVSDQHGTDGRPTLEAIDLEVEAEMKSEFGRIQLPVELIDITIGRANPPNEIKGQRVETARQEQLQQTEVQRQLAEQKREAAELQRAKSDNAYRQAMSLNTEQFVALEEVKMKKEVCLKGGCTFISGGSGVNPIFGLNK